MHWYRVASAQALALQGQWIGYDPFFAAGSTVGLTVNPATKIPAFAAMLLPSLDPAVAWKLYSFLAAIIAPICAPWAARILRQPLPVVVITALVTTALWWISMFRWFHTAGMVSFVLASYLALPYAAKVLVTLRDDCSWRTVITLGLLGAVGMLVHPLALITLCCLPFIIDKLTGHRIIKVLVCVPTIVLIITLPWLYPTLTFTTGFDGQALLPHQNIVDGTLLYREAVGIWRGDSHGSKLNMLILLATFFAAYELRSKTRERKAILPWIITGITLAFYGALGAALPHVGGLTQPNRFLPVAYLYLCIPAAIGIHVLLKKLWTRRITPLLVAIGAPVLLLSAVGAWEVMREISYGNHGHYGAVPPEVRGPGSHTQTLTEWLADYTTPNARVLF
jgi:hypothetical protein